jgi:hypothetical protein
LLHHFPDLSLLARPAANLGFRKTAATPALTPVSHSHPNSSQGAAPEQNPSNVKMRIAAYNRFVLSLTPIRATSRNTNIADAADAIFDQ